MSNGSFINDTILNGLTNPDEETRWTSVLRETEDLRLQLADIKRQLAARETMLNQAYDVDAGNPSDGQALRFNAASNTWGPVTPVTEFTMLRPTVTVSGDEMQVDLSTANGYASQCTQLSMSWGLNGTLYYPIWDDGSDEYIDYTIYQGIVNAIFDGQYITGTSYVVYCDDVISYDVYTSNYYDYRTMWDTVPLLMEPAATTYTGDVTSGTVSLRGTGTYDSFQASLSGDTLTIENTSGYGTVVSGFAVSQVI